MYRMYRIMQHFLFFMRKMSRGRELHPSQKTNDFRGLFSVGRYIEWAFAMSLAS